MSFRCQILLLSLLVFSLLLQTYELDTTDTFALIDKDHDGKLDRAEFSDYVVRSNSAYTALLKLSSAVNSDEKPISFQEHIDQILGHGTSFGHGFVHSLVIILITEIGDKTFFIAAVLAMRNARFVVYCGSMTALAVMHILSSLMGFALPALLPRKYTHFASILLFIYFGLKLLKDSYEMKNEGPSEELNEVEEELISKNKEEKDVEKDGKSSSNSTHNTPIKKGDDDDDDKYESVSINSQNFQVFIQALTLTFVAEWGDRSQIATIALASSKNIFGVIIGGLIGHAFCTGLAVIGGRLLAARISEKTVALVGGVLFILFAIHSFLIEE